MDCRTARLFLDAMKSHSMELHPTFLLDAGKSHLASLTLSRLIEFWVLFQL